MKLAWTGKYLAVVVDGRWEYVKRTRDISAAVILATTDAGEVVLIEQHRVPLGRRCIELPAGLVGDDLPGEDPATSAARELEEETGFSADHWADLGEYASSPGMVGETFHLFRATGLHRTGPGGGVAGETIITHVIKLADLPAFIAAKRCEGIAIDVKLLVAFCSLNVLFS